MIDLISRQEAIESLYKEIIKRRLLDDVNDGMLDEFDTEDILRKLPSAELEIIRCKNCKWWDREAEDSRMGYCHACKHGYYSRHWEIRIIRTYEEDFFCADAEPKGEQE